MENERKKKNRIMPEPKYGKKIGSGLFKLSIKYKSK